MFERNQKNNIYNDFNFESDNNKNGSKAGKILKRILLGLLFVILIVTLVFGIRFGILFYKYDSEAKEMVKKAGEGIFKSNLTSTIYDSKGEVITELKGEHDSYYLDYKEIPYFVKCAFIATEDRNFYEHKGVDYKAIARAFIVLMQEEGEITQGGSTITQQLARNMFLSHQVSMERKIKEMFIAMELEKEYTKDEIIEFYINNIYFGNGFYGIEAASRGYFSKSVTELSLAEITYICAIPNNPNMYNPYTNSTATMNRKNRILKQMLELDYIDEEMYNGAVLSTIVLYPSENKKNNYVETYVRYCATEALMKNTGFEIKYYFDSDEEKENYEKEYEKLYTDISNKLYTGGYKIYTTIDIELQNKLQETIDLTLSSYTGTNEEGIYEFQGSATCIDNATGKVVAIVGGRNQEYNGYTLNRAYQSYRQPGSTIKPILDYLPAFERGYLADSIVIDEKSADGPANADYVYEGEITIRRAVEKSKNTVAANLFNQIGMDNCINYLKNMDFKRIVTNDYRTPMAIGGMTYGVSTLEMASAYSTIENQGIYRTPTCINKITDTDDKIIISNVSEESKTKTVEYKRIYGKQASMMMSDVLKGVLTNGTGRNYNISSALCAAKTGTTNGNKDVWFVGYSSYYTTAVWVGYDYPKDIEDGYGDKCAGNIWKVFMEDIHIDKPIIDFVSYEDETEIEMGESTDESDSFGGMTEENDSTESEETTSVVIGGEIESEEESEKETERKTSYKNQSTTHKGNNNYQTTTKRVDYYSEDTTTSYYQPGYEENLETSAGGIYQENWG
ncbi:MAG: penicillin-binding protein [Lachnospiraceae bacterium]|nr:penicillin-binding protein [Lachnospiraceae bacterium]